MLLWFVVLALLGLWGIAQHPAVLWALNPAVGLRYLFGGGATALLVLGGVFLCATGAEVLYADMGHFGRLPIRLVWSCLVFPALLLNYAGQAAIVLAGAPTEGGSFFRLCPAPLLLPLVLLATAATVIASQAVITGAFSITRQAIQLGLLPRLRIIQTSAAGFGQIYLPTVNCLLPLPTLCRVNKGVDLRRRLPCRTPRAPSGHHDLLSSPPWRWPTRGGCRLRSGKRGGFLPAPAAEDPAECDECRYCLRADLRGDRVRHFGLPRGKKRRTRCRSSLATPVAQVARGDVRRSAGTEYDRGRRKRDIPRIVVWYLRHIRSLDDLTVIVHVVTALVPYVAAKDRMEVREIAPRVWRVHARFLPGATGSLRSASRSTEGLSLDPSHYFIGTRRSATRGGQGLRASRCSFWFWRGISPECPL